MKSLLLLLPLLGALVSAEAPSPTPTSKCQCPQVKCDSRDSITLCECLNSRESLCVKHCPDYIPTYRPCPTRVSSPTPTPSCTCETGYCIQAWPESCYCENAHKQACFEKCGGPAPAYQSCPSLPSLSLITKTVITRSLPTKKPPPTTTKSAHKPTGTNPICGGGRANYMQCAEGFTCIKNPNKPGCGPECDGTGICVEERMCGGFAGLPCKYDGQVCIDDPRDTCDPEAGGADCGGLCMWAE